MKVLILKNHVLDGFSCIFADLKDQAMLNLSLSIVSPQLVRQVYVHIRYRLAVLLRHSVALQ
jgi:hypothetical protein